MGLLEKAGLVPPFLGVAAEENLLHPLGLDRGGRDRHEWGLAAIRLAVEVARSNLLADAGWTGQHHPPITPGDLFKLRFQGLEGGT